MNTTAPRVLIIVGDALDAESLIPVYWHLSQLGVYVEMCADPKGIAKKILERQEVPFSAVDEIPNWDRVRMVVCATSSKAKELAVRALYGARAVNARLPGSEAIIRVGVECLYGDSSKWEREDIGLFGWMIVMDELAKASFLANQPSFQEGKILALGNASFDNLSLLHQQKENLRASVRSAWSILPGKKVVVFFASDSRQIDMSEGLDQVLAAVADSDALLVAKFHESDPERERWINYVREKFTAKGHLITDTPEFNNEQLICAADLVVGHYSTLLIRSSLLSVPTLFLLLPSSRSYLEEQKKLRSPYFSQVDTSALAARTVENIRLLLAACLGCQDTAPYVKAMENTNRNLFAGLVDGKATERIATLLHRLLLEQQSISL